MRLAATHVHVLGPEQAPPFWQGATQVAVLHVWPDQPLWQAQVCAAVQLPWLQDRTIAWHAQSQ